MGIVEHAGTDPAAGDASRRPRRTRTIPAPADLMGVLSEQSDILLQAKEIIEAQGASLAEMRDIIKNFQDNGITVQTPEGSFTISQAPAPKVEEPKSAEELAKDQYVVQGVFMDFIEIHSSLSKSFRDRRPQLASGVQARYSDHAEPTLMIMRKGQFGTNDQMYNTALTLRIHDDEPYISGDYMDYGRTVSMSDEQVKRCISTILAEIRREEGADDIEVSSLLPH